LKTALVLACDDRFIPYTSVVARRAAFYAGEKFPIIVVSDGVSDENKRLAQKFCPQISFIEASHVLDNRTFFTNEFFSRAVNLRLFFDQILADFDTAAYIDSDVSLLTDISTLVAMKPKSAPIIAAYDLQIMEFGKYSARLPMSQSSAYFNSGVLVMDLNAVREERVLESARQFAQERPDLCSYPDQDALNVALDGRWQILDWRWNAGGYKLHMLPKQPFLRHITGDKPWSARKVGVEKRYVDQWRSDLSESPWPERFLVQERKKLSLSVRPATIAIEEGLKNLFFAKAEGRRGNKVRFNMNFTSILATIETAAAEERLAFIFPEMSLGIR
jgi:lipopolysaccharide biosynthesis glycosyltransferase